MEICVLCLVPFCKECVEGVIKVQGTDKQKELPSKDMPIVCGKDHEWLVVPPLDRDLGRGEILGETGEVGSFEAWKARLAEKWKAEGDVTGNNGRWEDGPLRAGLHVEHPSVAEVIPTVGLDSHHGTGMALGLRASCTTMMVFGHFCSSRYRICLSTRMLTFNGACPPDPLQICLPPVEQTRRPTTFDVYAHTCSALYHGKPSP